MHACTLKRIIMTIKKWAINYCYERGMFEDQAEIVIGNVINSDEGQIIPWDSDINDYNLLKFALAISINSYAIKYIEKEYPLAWFKELFK